MAWASGLYCGCFDGMAFVLLPCGQSAGRPESCAIAFSGATLASKFGNGFVVALLDLPTPDAADVGSQASDADGDACVFLQPLTDALEALPGFQRRSNLRP